MDICGFIRCENNLMGREQPHPELGTHDCHLASKLDYGMPQQIPTASFWQKLCRFSRKLCMPTYLHRKCKHYHPTRASLTKMWTMIAATNWPIIIHPCSRISICMEFIMFAVWSYFYITRPYVLAFSEKLYTPYTELFLACAFIKVIYIVMNFVTAYVEPKRMVILDFKKIARHYLQGYFFFDLIAMLPIGNICSSLNLNMYGHYNDIIIVQLVQYVRLPTYFTYLNDILYLCNVKTIWVRGYFVMVIVGAIQIHWLTCLVAVWPKYHQDVHLHENSPPKHTGTIWKQYTVALYKVVNHFMLGSCTVDNTDLFPIILTIIVGFFYNVIAVGSRIISIYNNLKTHLVNTARNQVTANYLIMENVSLSIQQRVQVFFKHKRRVKYTSEKKLSNFHSEHLRYEIFLHTCSHLIATMDLFRKLSKTTIGEILVSLKPVFFLAGDIIMKENERGGDLVLISYGKVAFYTKDGIEISHASDGSMIGLGAYFCGMYLWTMVTIQATEAFLWPVDTIKNIIKRCDIVQTHLEESFEKMSTTFKQMEREKRMWKSVGPSANIPHLLRNRKILEQRKSRPDLVDL